MTRSAFSAAIAPIIGRLPASRSPPQPNTTISLPRRVGPQRFERLGERVGLVGVVDEDRRAVALADQFEPALGALELRERREGRRRLAAGGDGETRRHQRVLDLEGAGQRQPDVMLLPAECDLERLREALDRGSDQPDAVAATPDGEQAQPTLPGRRRHRVGLLVIGKDDGGAVRARSGR